LKVQQTAALKAADFEVADFGAQRPVYCYPGAYSAATPGSGLKINTASRWWGARGIVLPPAIVEALEKALREAFWIF